MSNIPIISIVAARSGTGKTTFLEKLIAELTLRGVQGRRY
ncbi:MAG: molybdopterin-guanine dinucleotide biosynthesis protein MobB [Desulfitobacteriia bacterium]